MMNNYNNSGWQLVFRSAGWRALRPEFEGSPPKTSRSRSPLRQGSGSGRCTVLLIQYY